jgi:hypothetical protein
MNTPRSKESVAHMDDMEAFSRETLKSVSKSFEICNTYFAKTGSECQASKVLAFSPFSKNLKNRQSLIKMLTEEMTIMKRAVIWNHWTLSDKIRSFSDKEFRQLGVSFVSQQMPLSRKGIH